MCVYILSFDADIKDKTVSYSRLQLLCELERNRTDTCFILTGSACVEVAFTFQNDVYIV